MTPVPKRSASSKAGKVNVVNLALDRIQGLEPTPKGSEFTPIDKFNPETWFENMIGVTKDRTMKPQKVRFRADARQVPYIRPNHFTRARW